MNSPLGIGRTILSVIGPHSGCGKTLFVSWLLRHIRGLGCLKLSPSREWPSGPASGKETIEEDFYLEDSALLARPGKDTALYLAVGAAQVERLRHRASGLAAGLQAALERFRPSMPLVVESSTAAKLLSPVAVVLVVRPPIREMKPATGGVLSLVTDLLVNASDREGAASAEAERLRREVPSLRPRFTFAADLISEPPPERMQARLRNLLTPAASLEG